MSVCPTCGQPEPEPHEGQTLTPRQRQILEVFAQGFSLDEVALRLYLAPETIRWHVKRACYALGVHSRHDAIQAALDLELIERP